MQELRYKLKVSNNYPYVLIQIDQNVDKGVLTLELPAFLHSHHG